MDTLHRVIHGATTTTTTSTAAAAAAAAAAAEEEEEEEEDEEDEEKETDSERSGPARREGCPPRVEGLGFFRFHLSLLLLLHHHHHHHRPLLLRLRLRLLLPARFVFGTFFFFSYDGRPIFRLHFGWPRVEATANAI